MGFDLNRFVTKVEPDLKCSICLNVLESPVVAMCGHVFCRGCMHPWLNSLAARGEPGSCPVCRKKLTKKALTEASLPLRGFLARLEIKCDNEFYGCKSVVQFGDLSHHLKVSKAQFHWQYIDFNPFAGMQL